MDDLVNEFLVETRESLDILDQEIVQLEQNPNDKALLGNIFRVVHTVKGTCGFLGLSRLEKVAHHGENVLGLYRDGVLEVTSDSVTTILESLDRIKEIVDHIEQTGEEGDGDDSALIAKLDAIEKSASGDAPEEDDIFTPVPASETAAVADALGLSEASQKEEALAEEDEEGVEAEAEEAQAPVAAKKQEVTKQDTGTAPVKKEAPTVTQSLRVNVDVLEDLMTMVSELVLTRNQLLQILRNQKESDFTAPLQRLNHVVSDLQEGVMKTRMQPIGNAWSKLPRIIRDLSNELGKKIHLEMIGQDTELDRQVLDLIKDPLTHMVRNSADHGIEMPDERVKAGKPEMGTVTLNAYHEGGHIIIQIKDDGKGLALEKIKKKILDNGVATEQQLAEMSETQIQQFIFHAGFSTAEKVTSVSGRGVGMDVVRTNIEKIGGTVELKSKEGEGSVFTIKIPLTLAIVSALIVEAGAEKYAIPQLSVQELVRASGQTDHRIEFIKGTPVLRLRDRLLPLVSLKKLLKLDLRNKSNAQAKEAIKELTAGDLEEASKAAEQAENQAQSKVEKQLAERDGDKYIVVTQVGPYSFGIIVDRVFDTEEIVVKPVAPILRHIDLFAGNTILGDGSVIMILDPNGIANATGDMSVPDGAAEQAKASAEKAASNEQTALILFRAGSGAPKAVPLSLVARLEDFESEKIEFSNDKHVIQYRGQLMPLVPFNDEVQVKKENDNRHVIVFADHLRSMGLVVDEILDIVDEFVSIETSTAKEGTFGSAIIHGKATDVINVGHYLSKGHNDWFAINETDDPFETDLSKHVLLVDDSPFFRNMLVPLLTIGGYQVTAVESPLEAIDLFEQGKDFDIVVSDIEMPEMTGFEFAEKVRGSNEQWSNVPMIALSSHATEEDFERGREVGFNDYVAKFDKDEILLAVQDMLKKQKTQKEQEKAGV